MPRRRRPPRPGALTELPPLKILGQIVALQGLYYAVALVLMLFTVLVTGMGFALDLVFGWEAVRGDTTQGWLMGFVWMLDGGFCMAVAIIIFVGRSKLVLDFALTIHALHLLVTAFYTGHLPMNMLWWVVMAASSALAVGLGTWGCQYRELKPISFGGVGARSADNGEAGGAMENGGPVDEEQGFSRGRGRGRGRDGGGEYEMVGLKKSDDP